MSVVLAGQRGESGFEGLLRSARLLHVAAAPLSDLTLKCQRQERPSKAVTLSGVILAD